MKTNEAWLIHCNEKLLIAVSDQEMVELVHEQFCYPVPGSPDYCANVVDWQGKIIPVMDLGLLHDASSDHRSNAYLCLLRYKSAPGTPMQHVALRVPRAPERILVSDDQVCEWPAEFGASLLHPVTLCCFSHEKKTVLILDIAKLCSAEFRDWTAAA